MFHFFGFLFIILLAVLVLGLSIIGTVLRTIFGYGKRRPTSNNAHRSYRNASPTEEGQSHTEKSGEDKINQPSGSKHKKIFTKEEGEYVDFEEMK